MSSATSPHVSRTEELLSLAAGAANRFLRSLPTRRVAATAGGDDLRASLMRPLPADCRDPELVLKELVAAVEPGLVASAGPRYFGFVIGGSHPVAVAADWLTSAWDQHGSFFASSPASAVAEDVVAAWLVDIFGLPSDCSVGFPTGAQTANFTALAAARHAVLARCGWDVESKGLGSAPPIHIVAGAESHITIFAALRMLGLGTANAHIVPADEQGRMRPDGLEETLRELNGPSIVCAQAGNVNSGAFDPVEELAAIVRRHGGWLHVDGAFGLWAGSSPRYRHLVRGIGEADSWATDAHKWLNVPYDSGIVFVRDAEAHRAAMTLNAAYLDKTAGRERDGLDWVPDASRRARAFVLWATLQTLGRRGIAELIERSCDQAALMAKTLSQVHGISIANDVELNQVLVRFEPPRGIDGENFTKDVVGRVQRGGVCWLGGTKWQGQQLMRISISNWMTTAADIQMSAQAIVDAYREAERAAA